MKESGATLSIAFIATRVSPLTRLGFVSTLSRGLRPGLQIIPVRIDG